MKTAVEGYDSATAHPHVSGQHGTEHHFSEHQMSGKPQDPRREWTAGSVLRLVLGAALLSLVYFLATWIPVDAEGVTVSMISGFLFFWVLGGLFTVAVLALSDRRS